jgi:hypothetical protein
MLANGIDRHPRVELMTAKQVGRKELLGWPAMNRHVTGAEHTSGSDVFCFELHPALILLKALDRRTKKLRLSDDHQVQSFRQDSKQLFKRLLLEPLRVLHKGIDNEMGTSTPEHKALCQFLAS